MIPRIVTSRPAWLLLLPLLLLLCCCLPSSSSPAGRSFSDADFAEHGGVFVLGTNVYGKLDIFLDLLDPDSAKAWPMLRRVVADHGGTMQFVFHVSPLSTSQTAIDFAKAAYVIGSHGGEMEVEDFFDDVLTNGSLHGGEGFDVLDADEWLADRVMSLSSMDSFKYESAMRDWELEDLYGSSRNNLGTDSSSGSNDFYMPTQLLLAATPAVYLNGTFVTYLDREDDFEIFEYVLASGLLLSLVDDHNDSGGGDGSSTKGDIPLWLRLEYALSLYSGSTVGSSGDGGAQNGYAMDSTSFALKTHFPDDSDDDAARLSSNDMRNSRRSTPSAAVR
ncbi:unnamed protein product [Ectocarpus fasciculatus]